MRKSAFVRFRYPEETHFCEMFLENSKHKLLHDNKTGKMGQHVPHNKANADETRSPIRRVEDYFFMCVNMYAENRALAENKARNLYAHVD